jgi:hypothetical protein
MKTLKFALIAAFLSVALIGYSTDHKKEVVRTIKITVDQALDERGLVREMYIQLDEKTFLKERTKVYVARIKYQKDLYLIHGTYKQWELFFLMDNHLPCGFKSAVGHHSQPIN